jgi:hypothetical protein
MEPEEEMDEAIRLLQSVLSNRTELDEATQKEYACKLQHCVIDFGASLDPLLQDPNDPELPDNEHIDLGFLGELRNPPDDFLLERIYVRKCMRELFRLFAKDAAMMEMTDRCDAGVGVTGSATAMEADSHSKHKATGGADHTFVRGKKPALDVAATASITHFPAFSVAAVAGPEAMATRSRLIELISDGDTSVKQPGKSRRTGMVSTLSSRNLYPSQ